ncbi:hypothetical protein [Tellurirhabdus bombi]|uniref:hypothetical protein n=1 Tax=Tellurirhabdus bombi TaxID=2907205 RepID=UPI001F2F5F76|nr:hypothetical protein [Tellurirhabdus bombi]
MVGKALLVTFFLLLGYGLLIERYQKKIQRTAQTIGQRNLVKGEEYLFEASSWADTVILGSSMSEMLLSEQPSKHRYNLAMPGLSAHEGLQLMQLAKHIPRVLLIEINTLVKVQKLSLMDEFKQPATLRLKQYLPFTRQKYQPAGVLKAVLRDWFGTPTTPAMVVSAPDSALLQKGFRAYGPFIKPLPPDSVFRQTFTQLRQTLDKFHRRGTRIIFYEMPNHPVIQSIPLAQKTRQFVQIFFNAPGYHRVALPHEIYQTSDGVHLLPPETVRYSVFLNHQLAQLPHQLQLAQSKMD